MLKSSTFEFQLSFVDEPTDLKTFQALTPLFDISTSPWCIDSRLWTWTKVPRLFETIRGIALINILVESHRLPVSNLM